MPNLPKKFKVGISTQDAGRNFSIWAKSATADKYFKGFFLIWALPLVLIFLFTIVNFPGLPKEIPLFYSRVWGEDQLADRIYLFLPAIGALLLGVFNLSLAVSVHEKDRVISYFLAGCAGLISFLFAITTFNIIMLLK